MSKIIFSAVENASFCVVLNTDSTSQHMLQLLTSRHAFSSTVPCIAAQYQIFRINYCYQRVSYMEEYTFFFSHSEHVNTSIDFPDFHKAPMLLISFERRCLLECTAAALHIEDALDCTWTYVVENIVIWFPIDIFMYRRSCRPLLIKLCRTRGCSDIHRIRKGF